MTGHKTNSFQYITTLIMIVFNLQAEMGDGEKKGVRNESQQEKGDLMSINCILGPVQLSMGEEPTILYPSFLQYLHSPVLRLLLDRISFLCFLPEQSNFRSFMVLCIFSMCASSETNSAGSGKGSQCYGFSFIWWAIQAHGLSEITLVFIE